LKKLLKSTIFLLIGIVMFFSIQEVMTPKWSNQENMDHIIAGLETLDANSIDVLFLGASHVTYGMSPMQLYEDTGICSYSLATSGQRIPGSYYLLKKAFEKQSPSVVMLDVSTFFEVEDEDYNAAWRYILDNFELDTTKIEMAGDYDEQWYSDGKWAAIFPIIKYHTRWSQLSEDDFSIKEPTDYYSAGQFVYAFVNSTFQTIEGVDAASAAMINQVVGERKSRDSNEISEEEFSSPLYEPTVSENLVEWLVKIDTLCAERGAELVLMKIPVLAYPQFYRGAWTKQKAEIIESIAGECEIPFFDLQYHVNSGINFQTDTPDSGMHLNFRGSQKVAKTIGMYLLNNYVLNQSGNLRYDESLVKFQKVREIALLQSEMSFASYMERLAQHKEDFTVFLVACEEYTTGMDDASYQLLENLGLQMIRDGGYTDAYVAVMDRGEVGYEAVSNRRIDYNLKCGSLSIGLSSSGWHTTPHCSIEINGVEYSGGKRGLNIVVYDHESGGVIDSVTFDTFTESKTATRNWSNVNKYLRDYESAVCF